MSATGYPMSASTYAAPIDMAGSPVHGRPRVGWPTYVLVVGIAAMAAALFAALSGLPGKMAYDPKGPGKAVDTQSYDMLAMNRTIDSNMKVIVAGTGDGPDQYNGLLNDIDKAESQIPLLAQSVNAMNGNVMEIDKGLSGVADTTNVMAADMKGMASVSAHSATTMNTLDGSISGLSGSMTSLFGATKQLTDKMAGIEQQAGSIATKRTNVALARTKDLNTALPNGVPKPTTNLTPVAGPQNGVGIHGGGVMPDAANTGGPTAGAPLPPGMVGGQ